VELIKLHPADIANIVEKLNLHQGSQLLKSLDEVTAAKVMEELEPEIQKLLVQHLGVDRAASIMERMSMDELVDLLQLLPDRETKRIFEEIPLQKDMKKVRNILAYDEDTAGGLMTTEFITARIESTVRDIKDIIKKVSPLHRFIYFVYIVDIENKFLGVVSMRKLIISNDEMHVKDLLKDNENMPALKISNNLSQIAEMMTKYNLMSVAVLDENNKILGVVTIDDIMRCLVPKA